MGRPDVDGRVVDVPYAQVRDVERFLQHTRLIGMSEGVEQLGDYGLTDAQRSVIAATYDAYRDRDVDHWTLALDALYVRALIDTATYNRLNDVGDEMRHVLEAMYTMHDAIERLEADLESMKRQMDSTKIEVLYRMCDAQVQFLGLKTILIKDDLRKSGASWMPHDRMWVMSKDCGVRFMVEHAGRVAFRASDD
jgi:hypothetical protein